MPKLKPPTAAMAAFLKRVRKLPAYERREVLVGLPDPTGVARAMLAKANAEIRRIERRGCSVSVINATNRGGEPFVVAGRARTEGASRIGDAEGTKPSRRLVSPTAVELEDRYDLMSTFEANVCQDPPSVTGIQMQLIEMRLGREKELPCIKGKKSGKSKNARKNGVRESPKAA